MAVTGGYKWNMHIFNILFARNKQLIIIIITLIISIWS